MPTACPPAGPSTTTATRSRSTSTPAAIYARWSDVVPRAFEPWLELPDPAGFEGKLEVTRAVAVALAAGGTTAGGGGAEIRVSTGNTDLAADLTYVVTELAQFNGATIDAFSLNYAARLAPVLSGQHVMACVVGTVLAGEQEIWTNCRDDVTRIADDVLTAMRASGERGAADVKTVVNVVASIAAAATIFVSGGTAAPIAGAISTTIGIISRFIPEGTPEEELAFGADSPDGVFAKLEAALHDLGVWVTEQEQALRDAAAHAHGELVSHLEAYDIAPPADLLAETDAAALYRPEELVILDHLTTIADVVRSTRDTVRLAGSRLPNALGSEIWSRPPNIGLSSEGHYFEWEQLVERVTTIVLDTAAELGSVADRLDWVAAEFAQTDAAVAEDYSSRSTG